MDTQGTIGIKATLDISEMQKNVQKYVQNIDMMQDHTDTASQSVARSFSRMQAAGAAFLSIDMAKRLASEMVSVYGTFQQLEIKFTSMLQSGEKAQKLMGELVNFAATTPFDLKGVSQSATQLVAYGTAADDVIDRLTRLGNIAAGLSQPIGDLVYLYGTSMTQGKLMTQDLNQFAGRGVPIFEELAKVIGVNKDEIRELAEQGKISFSYLEQVVDNLTNKGGMFFNLMEEQAKAVSGKISNLGDSLDMMFNEIGQANDGFINSALDGASYLIEHYKEVGTILGSLISLYGIQKAAIISVAAYQKTASNITYSVEIEELQKLLPLKEQASNADIKAAVASGRLTQSKAEQVIALRAELNATLQSLQATKAKADIELASAQASYKAALQRNIVAKQNMAVAQSQMQIAIKSGSIEEIELAKKNAQNAAIEVNNAAIAKNNAQRTLNTAKVKSNSASEALNSFQTGINTAAQNTNSKSTNILTAAKMRLAAASKALGLSMLANPYVLATAAIVALGYGIYKLITYQTDAEKAQEKLNKRVKEFNSETEAEQAEIDRLFGKLDGAKGKAEEYQAAKDAIIDKYGDYLKGLGDEIEKLNDVAAAYDAISAAAKQAALDRAITDSTSTAQKDWADKQTELMDDLEKAIRKSDKFRRKKGIDREVSAIMQMIKSDLKSGGKLSPDTQKMVDELTKDYYVTTGLGAGYYDTRNDVQVYVDRMKANNALLEKTYKDIHNKLGNDTNQYINLTAKQISTDIATFEAALARFRETGNNQVIQMHDGSWTNQMGEAEMTNHLRKLKDVQEQQQKAAEKEAKGAETVAQRKVRWAKELTEAEEKLTKLKDDNSTATEKEIETQQKLVDDLKKKLSVDDNSVKSKQKKQEEANRLKVEQAERQRQIDEMNQQDKERAIQAELELSQAKIDTMDEGFRKQQEQLYLNYRKAKADNDRRAAQYIKDQQETERKEWEKNHPKYKEQGLVFTPTAKTRNDLPQEKKDILDNYDKAAAEAREKAETSLSKALLEQYQDYTDERLAIEKKFNDDIAALRTQREKFQKEGNAEKVQQIDRAIAQATKKKGESLVNFDYEQLKKSPEYIYAFENLKQTSTETLNSLLGQLEDAKESAARVLSPDQLREYTSTIQSIMDELEERNPFQMLIDRKKELAEAELELAKAKRQLDAVKDGAKIVTGVKSTSLGEDGKIKVENTYLSSAEALEKYRKAKDKAAKANHNFIKAEKTAREKVDELAGAIQSVGDAIGGTSGEIISLIGDVALFATGTIDGISKVAQTGANAISAVEKASVILGIISTAIQLLQKIGEMGSNKAFKQYEAYAEKIKEINALTDAVEQYKIAALEAQQAEKNWFSEDNLKNLRDYRKLHDQVAEAYGKKAAEQQAIYRNERGGGWLTGAFNWVMGNLSALSWWDGWKNIWGQGNYDKGTTAAINNLRIETRKKSKGFLGSGIGGHSQKTEDLTTWMKQNGLGDLWSEDYILNEYGQKINLIDSNAAKAVIDNYGDKLVGQTKETLEALIKLREQYDEYMKQLHEYVSSLYEPLVDNFVDSLWDWLDNGKDALDSFKDYASDTFRDIVSDMMRTIVLDKVVGTFSDDIAALYEKYAQGTIDETELMKKVAERTEGLVGDYENNIPTLQNIMEKVAGYLQNAGIDIKQPEESSREGSKKGIANASQDSVDELNGRMTMTNVLITEVKAELQSHTLIHKGVASGIADIKAITISVNENVRIIKDNMNTIVGHLSNIDANTAHLEGISKDISLVKDGIQKMNDKGVKMTR